MIHEVLKKGAENAKTGKELARLLHVDVRTITATVSRERKAGWPICSESRGKHCGYYLAANEAERQRCCRSLYSRGSETMASYTALRDCDINNPPAEPNAKQLSMRMNKAV